MTESAGAANGVRKLLDFDQVSTRYGCDNELSDALLRLDGYRMLPEVDQDHFYLAAIIGVDGSGRIQYGQPIVEGAAASSTYLTFKPGWYFDRDTSRHSCTRERWEHQGFIERGQQINTGGIIALIARQRPAEPLNFDDWNNQAIKSAIPVRSIACDYNRLTCSACRWPDNYCSHAPWNTTATDDRCIQGHPLLLNDVGSCD